jgi:mono/diheme cytochrome c family protein
LRRASLLLAAALLAACSEAEPEHADPTVVRGRAVYLSICTACHNADPNLDGSLGPANAGASRELLEAKLLRGAYPPGYKPKRDSQVMPRFEHLASSIDDLAAFLAAAKRAP